MSIIKIILIFVMTLVLPMLYLFWLRKAKQRLETRLRIASSVTAIRQHSYRRRNSDNQGREESTGAFIGDIRCRFNARSPYIRCAVNPKGPCQDCRYYETKKPPSQDSE